MNNNENINNNLNIDNQMVVNNPAAGTVQNVQPVQQTPIATPVNVVPVAEKKKKQKIDPLYVWIFVFVGFILVIGVVLLIFLFNGSIFRRNRLQCSKVTTENGYTYTIDRTYKFDGTGYTRVYDTHIYDYASTYTDEMYNIEYGEIIDAVENGGGVTGYGYDTRISKDNNKVEIKAYTVSIDAPNKDDARTHADKWGFTCEEE